MNQKYTSANTSINSTKLPAIYKMIKDIVKETDQVIDYGCGKYFDDYGLSKNFHGYDPFNRPDKSVLDTNYDIALCSNVLNVIMEKDVRVELLKKLKKIASRTIITIYEGNGSGIGSTTKEDCYQLNRKKREYLPELIEIFGEENVKYCRGYFECIA